MPSSEHAAELADRIARPLDIQRLLPRYRGPGRSSACWNSASATASLRRALAYCRDNALDCGLPAPGGCC